MEPGTPERDPAEGRLVLKPVPAPTTKVTIDRWVRWTRTIVVEGPEEWVDRSRLGALADGMHAMPKGRITVETTEYEVTRHHASPENPVTNQVLKTLHDSDPDTYERIHGEGTADRSASTSTTIADVPVGQYL